MLRPPFSKQLIEINEWDVIVIGAGAAGLMASLELPENYNVLLLNRQVILRMPLILQLQLQLRLHPIHLFLLIVLKMEALTLNQTT